MIAKGLLAGAFVVALGSLMPIFATPTTRPASPAQRDPNFIGPRSWQRHFSIPPFVPTAKGLTWKVATSRPASAGTTGTFFTTRRRRAEGTTTASSTTTTGSSRSSEGRASRTERNAGVDRDRE